jgi:hypothetical protein
MKSSNKHFVVGVVFFIGGFCISLIILGFMISYPTNSMWDYPISNIINMVTFGMMGVSALLFCLEPLGLQIKRIKLTSN